MLIPKYTPHSFMLFLAPLSPAKPSRYLLNRNWTFFLLFTVQYKWHLSKRMMQSSSSGMVFFPLYPKDSSLYEPPLMHVLTWLACIFLSFQYLNDEDASRGKDMWFTFFFVSFTTTKQVCHKTAQKNYWFYQIELNHSICSHCSVENNKWIVELW
jgi:hypothetical protein